MERTALGQVAKGGVQLAVQVRAAGGQRGPADARAVDVRRQHDLQMRMQVGQLVDWVIPQRPAMPLHVYVLTTCSRSRALDTKAGSAGSEHDMKSITEASTAPGSLRLADHSMYLQRTRAGI